MNFSVHLEEWELTEPFRIAGAEWRTSAGIVVQLSEDGKIGRGEAQGVFYLGETAQIIFEQVHEVADTIRSGISREELQDLLPAGGAPILKIKLDGHLPYEKLAAIRAARPDAELVVDANQGWSFELLKEVIPKCIDLNLGMIEQPLARDGDEMLEGFESPITLAADESCLHTGELETAARRYSMINIKLARRRGSNTKEELEQAVRDYQEGRLVDQRHG